MFRRTHEITHFGCFFSVAGFVQGKILAGNYGFSFQLWEVAVAFPLNQTIASEPGRWEVAIVPPGFAPQ